MASGKSTVARELARRLRWTVLDFDEEIERRTGLSVAEIFRLHGETEFRLMEARLTDELAESEGVVLAPGGGWITQPGLLERLAPGAVVVWLRVSPEEAVRRAGGDAAHRPLLAGSDPVGRARQLVGEREHLYSRADFTVDVDGKDATAIAVEIEGRLAARAARAHDGTMDPEGY